MSGLERGVYGFRRITPANRGLPRQGAGQGGCDNNVTRTWFSRRAIERSRPSNSVLGQLKARLSTLALGQAMAPSVQMKNSYRGRAAIAAESPSPDTANARELTMARFAQVGAAIDRPDLPDVAGWIL